MRYANYDNNVYIEEAVQFLSRVRNEQLDCGWRGKGRHGGTGRYGKEGDVNEGRNETE